MRLLLFPVAALLLVVLTGSGIMPKDAQGATMASPRSATADDWNQVGHDPQHTGYSPETLGTNWQIAWRHAFQPERVHPAVQPIVYDDGSGSGPKVYVGTESGNLYALLDSSGAQAWKFTAGGPIVNSVAADNGLVFLAALDGSVYALDSTTGALVWQDRLSTRFGFSASPVLGGGTLFVGSRDGTVTALNPSNGARIWQVTLAAPLLMTPAYDNGNVFVGTMDLFVTALNGTDGSQVWKSAKIAGTGFSRYYPVVTAGQILLRPDPVRWQAAFNSGPGLVPQFPFLASYSSSWVNWMTTANGGSTNGAIVAAGNAGSLADIQNAQASAMNSYNADPSAYAPVLDDLTEANGTVDQVLPQWDLVEHNGPRFPPCVDSAGNIVVPTNFANPGWARMSLATGRLTDILYDGYNTAGQPFIQNGVTVGTPTGSGQTDETMIGTCSTNEILAGHIQEDNAQYSGYFNLNARRWTSVHQGETNGQMFNNTQSGGASPFTIANTRVYHIVVNELLVRTTQ